MVTRIRDDERGVAMVVAVMVVFVVMLLATVVFSQAVHNSTASGYDRKRLQSVDAAEAGLNYFFNYLEQTPPASLAARCGTVTAGICASNPLAVPQPISVDVEPGTAAFTITPTWYDAAGNLFNGAISNASYPRAVRVISEGTTNGTTPRKMETYLSIAPLFSGFAGAVVTNMSLNLVNSFTISGNNINDGDIYVTTGNASITSGNQVIKGNLYVSQGSLNVSAQVHIYGTAWARDSVTINQPQALIDQAAISSTSSLTVSSGNVTGVGRYCTTVSGTSNIHGGTVAQCQGPPTTPSFPHLTYNDAVAPNADPAWRANCGSSGTLDCYYLKQFNDCTTARTYVEGTGANDFAGGAGVPSGYSGVVVRILSTCTYSPSNNKTVSVGKDLAIITNGSLNFSQQSTWNGTGGTHKMFLIRPWPADSNLGFCPSYGNITVGNNTNFNSTLNVGLYTPCTATMSNQNAFYGQVVGGSVVIGNNWSMNYKPIVIPGALVTGFTEDVAYIREVA
jgi:Tfp pilus assembly protein PilX